MPNSSQAMDTMPRSFAAYCAPYQSTTNPSATCVRASANFNGVLGSQWCADKNAQSAVNTRPKMRMYIGLAAWNIDAGISLPPMPMPMFSGAIVQSSVWNRADTGAALSDSDLFCGFA